MDDATHLLRSQIFTLPSIEAEATKLPDQCQSTYQTGSPCPLNVCRHLADELSHRRTVWSPLDVATSFPLRTQHSFALDMHKPL